MDIQLKIQRTEREIERLHGCLDQLQKERQFANKGLLLTAATPILGMLTTWSMAALFFFTILGLVATVYYLTAIRKNEYQIFIQDHKNEIESLKQ